jgi:Flp pilus assembly CpaE family ATPase
MRFLLKLENGYSVMDASEHAHRMDETLWPQMVTRFEKLDVLHAGPLNPDVRIEPVQVRNLLEFARRHYRVICADLSGNLERYSFEVMNEAKRIFLVCTGEMSSLHLAREKFQYLRSKDLGDRVALLVNRCQKRPQFGLDELEDMLGAPVFATFANDYTGVQKAISAARGLDASSELGKQMAALANSMLERRTEISEARSRRFIEYFSIVPGRYSAEGRRSAG